MTNEINNGNDGNDNGATDSGSNNNDATSSGTPASGSTDTGATGDNTTAMASAEQTAAPAPTAPTDVAFSASGTVAGIVRVPLGTKVKDALRKIKDDVVVSAVAMRDAAGAAVGAERTLTADLAVTVTAKSSGG